MNRSLPSELSVAVVGGGPAGSICALLLALSGQHVCLIHRGGSYASRVELVSGRARRLVERWLGEAQNQALRGLEIYETVSLWGTPGPLASTSMFNPWGAGMAVNRAAFDQALRDAAACSGVMILEGEVRSAARKHGQWELELQSVHTGAILNSHSLVLATGSTGRDLVSRGPLSKSSQYVIMAAVGRDVQRQRHTLFVEAGKLGWWYMLPDAEGGYFAGYCSPCHPAGPRRKPSHETFVKELRSTQILIDVVRDYSLSSPIVGRSAGPQEHAQVVGDGWIAIGDAAFVSDPLSGMGIDFAIESAQRAADAVLVMPRLFAVQEYQAWVSEYACAHKSISGRHNQAAKLWTS